jgi:hypothetical protein
MIQNLKLELCLYQLFCGIGRTGVGIPFHPNLCYCTLVDRMRVIAITMQQKMVLYYFITLGEGEGRRDFQGMAEFIPVHLIWEEIFAI